MSDNKQKHSYKLLIITLIVVICVVLGLVVGFGLFNKNKSNVINTDDTVQSSEDEIIVPEETQKIVQDTKQATQDGEDLSTTETIEGSEQEEQSVVDESAIEQDATVEQENISYNGDNSGEGINLLGSYNGLTYYSQADPRWANIMYSSIGDRSQTMKSSACGPTSAAMVVSSSKGTILPTTMAQLSVANGYRTANNGTAWSYYSFVADYFDFEEYRTTSNFNTAMSYLRQDEDKDGVADYFIIASCGSGLWTSGGHYITLVGDNGGTITVYDPYLYPGKFDKPSRRGAKVKVSGNSAYVSESKFKTYSNTKNYWIYSNDEGKGNPNAKSNNNKTSYTRYVATSNASLNVRSSAGGSVIGSLKKGTAVTVVGTEGSWSKIVSPISGYVSTGYLSASPVYSNSISKVSSSGSYSTKIGNYYTLKKSTTMYSKGNLTGTQYNYLPKTKIKVISHYNSSVDYVKVVKTGRYAYCPVKAFKGTTTGTNSSSSNVNSSTAGKYYTLKTTTKLYRNSSMTGTYYTYLPKTQIKVLQNVSGSVDKVQVTKTGRIGYVYKSAYSTSSTKSTTKTNRVTNTYEVLKGKTSIYKNSNLKGTYYTYLPGTKVQVIRHVSSSKDYVKVVKTGRYGYVKVNAYK